MTKTYSTKVSYQRRLYRSWQKKFLIPIFCALSVLCIINHAGAEKYLPHSIDYNAEYVQDEIIVMFDANCTQAQIDKICLDSDILEIKGIVPKKNIYLLKIPPYKTVEEVINEISQYPEVIHAEPNYESKVNKVPDDTYYSST